MNEVFISYKAEEYEEANNVRIILEKNGISCWMAPESIKGGLSYAIEIPKAIKECRIFVVILSEKAQNSKWVPREIDQAINYNKIIMPFAIENCPLKDEFNFYLTNVQRFEAYKNKSLAIEKMVSEIKAILNVSDVETSLEKAEVVVPDEEHSINKKLKKEKKKIKKVKKEKTSKNKKVVASIVVVLVLSLVLMLIGKNMFIKSEVIAGKEVKVNSTHLIINDVEVITSDDVEKISSLKKINNLSVCNCNISESALQKFVKMDLKNLTLDNCGIDDNMLSKADFSTSSLTSLNLSNNKISDLNNIKPLSDTLNDLTIDNNSIKDFSVLEEFDLTSFSANGTGIKNLNFLSNYKKINNISINNNLVSSLLPLSKIESVRSIEVSNNKLKDLKGLENSLYLGFIKADSNQLTSLNDLSNQTKIYFCSFNNNKIEDISILAKFGDDLKTVSLNNNMISDISSLSKCSNITEFYIDNNKIASLSPLENKQNLKKFSAKNNKISDLSFLANCTCISYLNLSDNEISNISSLKNVFDKSNVYVDLSMNRITKFDMPYVSYSLLNLHGNKIENFADVFSRETSKLIVDYSQQIEKFDGISKIGTMYIVDCPKDKQIKISELLNYNVSFITSDEIKNI